MTDATTVERERIARLTTLFDGERLHRAIECGTDPETAALAALGKPADERLDLPSDECYGDAAIERARALNILEMRVPDGIYQTIRMRAVLEGWTPGALAVEVARVKRDLGPSASLEALRNGCQAAPYGGDPTSSKAQHNAAAIFARRAKAANPAG